MRLDRIQAINLRRQGKSYLDINKELGIPKSTLSDWFKNNLWSQSIKVELIKKAQIKAKGNLRLMAAANKAKWDNWHKECREEARKEFGELKADPIFLARLMLYWGEGERVLKSSKVRLGNSDPEMLKVFYLFLIRIGTPTSKITAQLILYPDLNIKTQLMYWSKSLKIPLSQFIKSAVIHGKHPEKRLSYGVYTFHF